MITEFDLATGYFNMPDLEFARLLNENELEDTFWNYTATPQSPNAQLCGQMPSSVAENFCFCNRVCHFSATEDTWQPWCISQHTRCWFLGPPTPTRSLNPSVPEWPRAGHFRYFWLFSIIKNDFFCIFYQANSLFLHQSYLKSPLPVKLTW